MVLSEQDFRCHVTWCATRLMRVLTLPISGYAEVCDPTVSALIEDDVLGFDVAVDDVVLVQVTQPFHHASH